MISEAVPPILVSTIVLASLYALLASGLSLIWSTLGVFNYAHGAMLMVAAYLIWTLSAPVGLPVWLAAIAAVPVMAFFGVIVELVTVRPFLKRPEGVLLVMVSTLAAASIIEGALQLRFGPESKQIRPVTNAVIDLGGTPFPVVSIIGSVLALVLVLGLIFALTHTEWGTNIRAVEQNRDMARLIGIRPTTVYMQVFAIAAVLVSAAAWIYGSTSSITPAKGFDPLMTAFVVLVFGGSANLWGSLIGALAIALLDSSTTYFVGLQWSPIAVFGALVAVMLVRPEGLVKERSS